MPHDLNGKKIDEGDVVVAKHWAFGNKPTPCVVHGVSEGSTSCNVQASPVKAPLIQPNSFNASEVEVVVKADGSKP